MMKKSLKSGDPNLLTEFPDARMAWGCEGVWGAHAPRVLVIAPRNHELSSRGIVARARQSALLEPEDQDLQKHALNVYEFASVE
jgi:hypothetical protein